MKYEISMIIYVASILNQQKIPKWLAFKKYRSHFGLIFDVHILRE